MSAGADRFRNPAHLVVRTLRDGGRAGRAAVLQAGLALVATPLDLVLERREALLHQAMTAPEMPIIIVVGPPRSGTTIVAQTIARTLPVSHLTNVTAMFPRSPLTAARFTGVHPDAGAVSAVSHYGRTAALGDHNDALPLWDRWLGHDRSALTVDMSLDQRRSIRRFFATYETAYGRPVVAKNNNLLAHAHAIGALLPTATFICMHRDPVALAQSLLIARRQITGSDLIPYGLHPDRTDVDPDVLVDVVRQIEFYDELTKRQLQRLGPDRFRSLSYEEFCARPERTLHMLATEVLGDAVEWDGSLPHMAPLTTSVSRRVAVLELDRLRAMLGVTRSTS